MLCTNKYTALACAVPPNSAPLTAALTKLCAWEKKVQKVLNTVSDHRMKLAISNAGRNSMFEALGEVYDFNDSSTKSENPISSTMATILPAIVGKYYKVPEIVGQQGANLTKTEQKPPNKNLMPNSAPFMLDKFDSHIIMYIERCLQTILHLKKAFEKVRQHTSSEATSRKRKFLDY